MPELDPAPDVEPVPELAPGLRDPAVEASSAELPALLRLPPAPVPVVPVPEPVAPEPEVPAPDPLVLDPVPLVLEPDPLVLEPDPLVPDPLPLELEPLPLEPVPGWPLSHPTRLIPLTAKAADVNRIADLRIRMCTLLKGLRKKVVLPRTGFRLNPIDSATTPYRCLRRVATCPQNLRQA
jgi:hypothetical protein